MRWSRFAYAAQNDCLRTVICERRAEFNAIAASLSSGCLDGFDYTHLSLDIFGRRGTFTDVYRNGFRT
jgi:hypothetical protein